MISAPRASAETADAGNVKPERLDTNQQTTCMPYWFGRRWFGLTWCVSQVLNPQTIKKSSGGKSGKGGGGTSVTYRGDLAGLIACGPADFFEALKINGKIVWSADGGISRDGSNPTHCDISIPNYLTQGRLHWGTSAQPADWIVLGSGGEEHPNYKDEILIELKGLDFGSSNTPPNVEVLLERAPFYSGLDGNRSREGANPMTAIAEVLSNDFYGAGLLSIVDESTASTLATAIASRTRIVSVPGDSEHVAKMGYISGFLKERQTIQSFIGSILENFDGWARRKGDKIEFGYYPHDGVVPTGLVELSLHDLVEDPDYDSPGFDDDGVLTDTIVNGPDRDLDMEDSWEPGSNPAVRERIGQTIQKTFSRSFVITSYQRKEMAQELANYYSNPAGGVDIVARREKAVSLLPGDRFILNYGPSTSRRIFRIIRRTDPSTGGTIKLTVVSERTVSPLAYIAPANPVPNLPEPPTPVPIVHARIFQLPTSWTGKPWPSVVAIAAQPSANSDGFRVHYSTSDTTYDQISDRVGWAIYGTTAASLTSGTTTFTLNLSAYDLGALAAQTAAAQADDTLLLVIDNEIMSIGDVTALGGGQYSVTVLRARRDTVAASHSSGAGVYVVERASLVELEHADFPRTASIRYFKLQDVTAQDEQELAYAIKLTFTFTDTRPAAPTGVTATPYAGYNLVEWIPPTTGVLADEFHVYRYASNTPASAVLIGDTRDRMFRDPEVVVGDGWYYFVSSEDIDDVEGDKSAYAYCVTIAGPITANTPSDPSPVTKTGQGTRIAGDGAVKSWLELSVPAKPSNAEWVDVLFRLNISGEWRIAGQYRNTSSATLRLDDLTPGESYQVASRARNPGAASSIVQATSSPFTAPGKTTPPNPPTAVAVYAGDDSTMPRPPSRMWGATRIQSYAVTVVVTQPADKDIAAYHVIGTVVDSDGAADSVYINGPDLIIPAVKGASTVTGHYYALANTTRYLRILTVDTSSNISTWTVATGGDIASKLKKPVGDLVERDGNAAGSLTGITAWGFTSARRFKKNIRPLSGPAALSELVQWKPKVCDWRTKNIINDVVFIADDIAKIRPDAVYRDDHGRIDSMDYTKAIPLLVAAVTHQKRRIEALAGEVARLRKHRAKARKTKRIT